MKSLTVMNQPKLHHYQFPSKKLNKETNQSKLQHNLTAVSF